MLRLIGPSNFNRSHVREIGKMEGPSVRKLVVIASVILVSACQGGTHDTDESGPSTDGASANTPSNHGGLPVATACPKSKQGNIGDNVICEEGDPAIIAALPAWAKPPQKVEVLSTTINKNGFGYGARYDGPLSDIEPLYRSQIERAPGIRLAPQNGSRMLVGAKVGDNTSGTVLSLTPIQKSSGGELVEIRFYQHINQSPPAVDSVSDQSALPVVAMNALNNCVSMKVTTLVEAENGNVDYKSTADIANQAVSLCDNLIDAAANEHLSNLKTIAEMPANDPASVKMIANTKRALETRSFSDWRKFHTNLKIGFAKTYVRIVADRFKPRPDQEESGRATN